MDLSRRHAREDAIKTLKLDTDCGAVLADLLAT